jgi:hypothetical protein
MQRKRPKNYDAARWERCHAGCFRTGTMRPTSMAFSKIKVLVVVALMAAFVCAVIQQITLRRMFRENAALQEQLATLVRENAPAPAPASGDPAELDRLRAEHDELLRLRGEVAQLRRERDELSRKLTSVSAATNKPAQLPTADQAWVQQMLSAPVAQQGAALGALRGKMLSGDAQSISASELALRDAMAGRNLNSLERSPGEFADFQTAFIQSAIGLSDPEKTQQIHEIIQKVYERAVGNGLDIPSKPADGVDTWVNQRYQLDRRGTSAVQGLLTPEQRSSFDRAFLGIMGVDLGMGVDKSNYPPGVLGP